MPGKRKPKDDEQSIASENKQPVKNVQALMGEGEKFFRDQLFTKAIQCYTEVLELSPSNKNALVERAACYLKIGKNDLALADAEESLKENKEFTKGLYQKAEALYAMGEFELALVFYHRGKKLRSDVREFQLGINKAQEAIDNCVGDPNVVKLEIKGDLSYFDKPDEKQKKQKKTGGYQKPFAPSKQQVVVKREKRPVKLENQKTVKQLLGELYADKVYLEKLLEDDRKLYSEMHSNNNSHSDRLLTNANATRANTRAGDAIWGLANNGLDFLDSRTEFWRQQKPIYARRNSYSAGGSAAAKNHQAYILKQLDIIDNLQSSGKHAESLEKANRLMAYVNRIPDSQLSSKKEIISNIYSNIGNAYLELGQYDNALQAHQKDLEISRDNDIKQDISRAYENIGRVYARNGKYKEAIQVWEKKLPLAESDTEKAWLYHEIGRCHLEMNEYMVAKDYGEKSLECAQRIDDEVWVLNATVLIAQSQVKIGDVPSLEHGIENFEKALKITEKQNDHSASESIKQRLAECREKLKKLQIDTPRDGKKSPVKAASPTKEAAKPVETKPAEAKPSQPKPTQKQTNYQVEVKTGDEGLASTTANVAISLIGTDGNLENITLDKPESGKNPFESGNVDKFTFSNNSIGKIKRLKIGIDSKSPSAAWKCDYVQIVAENETYLFNVSEWIQNPQLSVEVDALPNKTISKYQIEVKTCDEIGSGTDAGVSISIYGTLKDILDIPLKKPQSGKNPFENGSLDTFIVNNVVNVGKIKKITIGHNDKGLNAAWKLNHVKITFENETYVFNANRWLDKSQGDKAVKVDLVPDSKNGKSPSPTKAPSPTKSLVQPKPSGPPKGPVAYQIEVKTADDLDSGTDAEIVLSLTGEFGNIESMALKNSASNKNPFERAAIDRFTVTEKSIGKITKMKIGPKAQKFSTWKLEYVKILVEQDHYVFNINKWLDELSSSVEMEPSSKQSGIAVYKIEVKTSNESGSGTDAEVSISIYGTNKDLMNVVLAKSETNKNAFESGGSDVFTLIDPINVGKIKKINIGHNDKGLGSAWKLDWVKVTLDKQEYKFTANRWLDKSKGDKAVRVDLTPDPESKGSSPTKAPSPSAKASSPTKGEN